MTTHTRIPSHPGHTPTLPAAPPYCNDGSDRFPVYPRYVALEMSQEPSEFPVSPIIIALALLAGGWLTFAALYLGALWLIDNFVKYQ